MSNRDHNSLGRSPLQQTATQVILAVFAVTAIVHQLTALARIEKTVPDSAAVQHTGWDHPTESPLLLVNLNTASVSELALLPNIGHVLAKRIHNDRQTNGPFHSVNDLQRVHGIGEKTIAAGKNYCFAQPKMSGLMLAESKSAP